MLFEGTRKAELFTELCLFEVEGEDAAGPKTHTSSY